MQNSTRSGIEDFDDFFKSAYHILEITERDPSHL
jgi:hypothetical protein